MKSTEVNPVKKKKKKLHLALLQRALHSWRTLHQGTCRLATPKGAAMPLSYFLVLRCTASISHILSVGKVAKFGI